MSKDRKKLLHIHSSVNDKQPTPATLELGELGVNNAKGNAFISTKNSNGEVVRFSEDETIIGWMEQKEVFPYEGYVRGSDNSRRGVTASDLLQNKSNIIIKLNQVVPENTDYSPYDEKVNGAKDIYGNLINPISVDEYKDGAGIAIDMSQYAMIGANPNFSSVTSTCHTVLEGTTEIIGTDGDCGSYFGVDVAEACIESDNLSAYGRIESNFGTSCDGERISSSTTLKGGNVLIGASDNTDIYGKKVTISAKTTDIGLVAKEDIIGNASDITLNASSDVYLNAGGVIESVGDEIGIYAAENLCESGKNVTIFASEGGKLTIGGTACSGNSEGGNYDIVYVRNADNEACGIKSTTIDGALHEVFDRSRLRMSASTDYYDSGDTRSGKTHVTIWQDSGDCANHVEFDIDETIVSMSAETYSPDSEMLMKYTLWQYIGGMRKDIGEINIPKDHLLRDVAVVYGIWDDETKVWTDCEEASDECHWYIRMEWNVWTTSSASTNDLQAHNNDEVNGHPDHLFTYLPADDFIKDITSANTDSNRGVNVNVWYDGKRNLVSADTEIHFDTPSDSNDFGYEKKDGEHWESGTTIVFNEGEFNPTKYKPWSASTSVNIPTCVSHLNRHTIKFQSGSTSTFNNQTYDPGKDCANSADTINIPTAVSHLNRGKFTVKHCTDEVTFDPATDNTITMTHGTLKLTHNGLVDAEFDPCTSTSYTMPHSSLTINYEATSGKSGVVKYNTSADTSISIPTNVNHLNRGKLTLTHCSDTVTFDPATNTSMTMNHYDLKYTHNGYTGTYNPCTSGTSFVAPHSALTINYGSTCNDENAVDKTYDTSAAETIVIPKTISDITGGAVEYECNDNCITVNKDICMQGNTVAAKAFYSKSDRNLKENINSLMHLDYSKADRIEFKSFNFKNDETKTKTYGVIAQDVQDANLSEIVHTDADGTLNVDYISLLILKVASLEDRIKDLSNEIKNLKENK